MLYETNAYEWLMPDQIFIYDKSCLCDRLQAQPCGHTTPAMPLLWDWGTERVSATRGMWRNRGLYKRVTVGKGTTNQ